MELVAGENVACSNEPSTSADKKKPCQSQQGIKKRRKIDCKTDEDAANYFAETYFNRVKTKLNEAGFEKFIKMLCEYDTSSARDEAQLYKAVSRLYEEEGCPELTQQFLCFIRPQFAKQISKYQESIALRKAWSLFNGLDSYHFNKMLNVLESLSTKANVKASDVEASLRPLFKTQSNIVPTICQLFPSAKPPSGDVNEFEKVLDIGSDKDMEYEHVYVPRGQTDRSCPGQSACQCACHGFTPKPLCSACNVRFINGRIYVQRGKEIRSARVNFSYGVSTDEMQRKLHPSYYAQLQALAESQPKTSPSKGEKKDRKTSQSDSTSLKTEVKNPLETKPEAGAESVPVKSDPKPSTVSTASPIQSAKIAEKAGKSSGIIPAAGVCSTSGSASSAQASALQQVFYEEHGEGYLEFFMEESDNEDMDTTLSDNDVQPSSSDELSSPTHRSPGKSNGKKSKSASKRNKK